MDHCEHCSFSFFFQASKKIAGQFGATAMDLQLRYGSAHGHMETLQKNEARERVRLC